MGEDYDLIADGAGLFERRIGAICSHRFFEEKLPGRVFARQAGGGCRIQDAGWDGSVGLDGWVGGMRVMGIMGVMA